LLSVRIDELYGAQVPLIEHALLSTDLTDNTLFSELLLLVNREQIDFLADSQLLEPGCLLQSITTAKFTNLLFNMTTRRLSIEALDQGVEQDIDKALNDAFSLFVETYRVAIPAFFNGFVAQPLRA